MVGVSQDEDLNNIVEALEVLRLSSRCERIALAGAGVEDVAQLTDVEEQIAMEFKPLRREQFARGRGAARAALQRSGAPCLPIRSSPEGVPLFPAGFVGSISHKVSWAIAAAAPRTAMRSVGVDLEFDEDSDEEDLLARVCTPHERALLGPLRQAGLRSPGTWLHSAKEAAYKALFVGDGIRFDFEDIELELDAQRHAFRVARLQERPCPRLRGRYAHVGGWLVCAVFLKI